MICLEDVIFSKTHVWTSSTLVLILRFDKTSILFLFFVVFFLFVLTFFDGIISKVVAPRQIYTTIEGIKASIDSLLIFLNVLLLVTSTLSQQFLLFLYMKSIACHIYHTFLKIPQMIFCVLHLFDFPCWILLFLGIGKLLCHFRRLPERALGLLVLRRNEILVSLFHCLESSRKVQPSISNIKS